jgi:hypothetical protein
LTRPNTPGRYWPGSYPVSLAAALCAALLSLTILAGCSDDDAAQVPQSQHPWFATAVVADLSDGLDPDAARATLAGLAAIGFDTVMLDARSTPAGLLAQWIETAADAQLRTVLYVAEAEKNDGLAGVDGIVVSIERPADWQAAKALTSRLRATNPAVLLIADIAPEASVAQGHADLPPTTALFDAIITLDDTRLQPGDAGIQLSDSQPATPDAATARTDDEETLPATGLPAWHRLAPCQASETPPCPGDVRRLVMGLLQASPVVTDVPDGPYWRDVHASLTQLREAYWLLLQTDRNWYASDTAAGVIAYRHSDEARDHLIVAINVSDTNRELPLPFGFMAVSKVRLWASYDPQVRELVTSRPISLPARSAVVVIQD